MSKALKAQDSALILIDHQIISMSMIKTQALEIAKHNNIALVKAAKILGIPSVWTSSNEDANKDWWMPGLEEINRDAYAPPDQAHRHYRFPGTIRTLSVPSRQRDAIA